MKTEITVIANRTAKEYGTTWATRVVLVGPLTMQLRATKGHAHKLKPRVVAYDAPHAESRTGIRANLTVLKRFWNTYHYVSMHCEVEVPNRDEIYNDDTH